MKKQSHVESRSYLEMAKTRPGDVRRERACFKYLLEAVPPLLGGNVLEVFGGSGLFREVLGESHQPQKYAHETWDHDPGCVKLLRELYPDSIVYQVDSFNANITQDNYELISADFNSWTILKYERDPAYRKLTDRIFEAGATWVQLTDSAVNKLHLNFRTYAKALGLPEREFETKDRYAMVVSEMIKKRYGYGAVRTAYHNGAAYYLFKKDTKIIARLMRNCSQA